MQARYTFFEAAQQHGYVAALMGPRVAKDRERCQIIIDPKRGRVFQVFKTRDPEVVYFEFVIPERDTTESQFQWREKVKRGLDKVWKDHERSVLETKARRAASYGPPTEAPLTSEPSKIESSSTDAPPNKASSHGPYVEGVPATQGSGPLPSTRESLPTVRGSSTVSAPRSRKSGSKSRSSSGA